MRAHLVGAARVIVLNAVAHVGLGAAIISCNDELHSDLYANGGGWVTWWGTRVLLFTILSETSHRGVCRARGGRSRSLAAIDCGVARCFAGQPEVKRAHLALRRQKDLLR